MIHKLARALTRKPRLIAFLAVLLLIPSAIGMAATKINYDLLTYLPEEMDSSQGMELLEEPFHMAATSMLIVEDMPADYTAGYPERTRRQQRHLALQPRGHPDPHGHDPGGLPGDVLLRRGDHDDHPV